MILCLEGVNGAGKSSFAGVVADLWHSVTGCHTRRVDLVQYTAFGRTVWEGIMRSGVDAEAEALAFVAARIDGLAALRAEASRIDGLLVLERWAGAVAAYGRADHGDPRTIDLLEALLWERGGFPCVLIDTPGAVAQSRLNKLPDLNKFETRGDSYLDEVGAHYREWASRRGVRVVDGAGSDQQLLRCAREVLAAAADETMIQTRMF